MGDWSLVSRLRGAAEFASIAGVVIDELRAMPGAVGVAVEAHVDGAPVLWLATEAFAREEVHRYLAGDFARDRLLVRVREAHAPVREGVEWIAPIVGCGELLGAIRVVVDDAARECGSLLQLVSMLTSVRVAQVGGLDAAVHALTARQHEIAVLVSRGCTNQEIGRMLAISSNAVKKHVSRVLEVLGVTNRTELAVLASHWSGTPSERLDPAIYVLRADRVRAGAAAA